MFHLTGSREADIFPCRFTLDPSLSLARVAETLPFTFTGADLYALCSDAMLKAVTRSARLVDERMAAVNAERAARSQNPISVAYYFDHYSTDADTDVMVTEEDFQRAKSELVPSVSLDELRHYERVRNTFEGATKKETPNPEVEKLPTISPVDTASSLASNHHSDRGLKSLRARTTELLRRGNKGKAAHVNGGDTNYSQSARPSTDRDSDNDHVVRTDRLTLGDMSSRSPVGRSKGKGKAKEVLDADHVPQRKPDGISNSDDLYD